MLFVDMPSEADILTLAQLRSDACVSIYLPTTPLTHDIGAAVIEFGNLGKEALRQLREIDFDKRRLALIAEQLDDLAEDEDFWAHQAHSLAVFVTPDTLNAYRLANRLTATTQVSDRFHIKPLLRAVTFKNGAFVLALSENAARLIRVFPDLPPEEIRVPDMPKDAASSARQSTINDRSHSRRIHGSEGQKVRLRQYARKVDEAIKPFISQSGLKLIVAATEPLASIYPSINSYAELSSHPIAKSPDNKTPAELAEEARAVIDEENAAKIGRLMALFSARESERRVIRDIDQIGRAARNGDIDTLMIDIDKVSHGFVDDDTGAVTISPGEDAQSYDVESDIVALAIGAGARVLAVRQAEMPDGASIIAISRRPL